MVIEISETKKSMTSYFSFSYMIICKNAYNFVYKFMIYFELNYYKKNIKKVKEILCCNMQVMTFDQ